MVTTILLKPTTFIKPPSPLLAISISNLSPLTFSPHKPLCSLSPPTSREEAISQAKTCLFTTLQKPLTNPLPLVTKKLKKQKQPRYRIEIPLADESPDSLPQLALAVLSNIPIMRKGLSPNILILWNNPTLLNSALMAFNASDNSKVVNSELGSCNNYQDFGSPDIIVFMAPEANNIDEMKMVCAGFDPRPVVLFNPQWGFEEEMDFGGSFVGSFDVVYSFMGLEVKGIFSRRNGVVFRNVRDGVGEGWVVMVEDEDNGEMKVVSRFKKRPSIVEVETLLYNLMAAKSPVTKSVKFLKDLSSKLMPKKSR